jgi:hypothetical protein
MLAGDSGGAIEGNRRGRGRQDHTERSARTRHALGLDAPAVRGDDAVGDREAEAGAGPDLLRREERLEDAAEALGRDPGPVVPDGDAGIGALPAVRTQMFPPAGAASQALASRFMNTWFSCGSHSTGDSASSYSRWTVRRSRHRDSGRSVTSIPSRRSTGFRTASPSREKLRRSRTIAVVRSAPRASVSMILACLGQQARGIGRRAVAARSSRRRSGATLDAMRSSPDC